METNAKSKPTAFLREGLILSQVVLALALAACENLPALADTAIKPPAVSEFGFGPRTSSHRVYTAQLEPNEPLRLRRLQTVSVRVKDAKGNPVEDAKIAIDGGMPEHRHGLPTQPRVSRHLGDGVYEIEGVRFSMGGWWELRLVIDSPAGNDSITFNLGL